MFFDHFYCSKQLLQYLLIILKNAQQVRSDSKVHECWQDWLHAEMGTAANIYYIVNV